MTLTVEQIYSVRFEPKLPLPPAVQQAIAKLRITPAEYKPARSVNKNNGHRFFHNRNHQQASASTQSQNWRESALVDIVRRVREREDAEYSEIFSIFNKLSPGNIEKLSSEAIDHMNKRDEQFRLRISVLLFDEAISQPGFSGIMADCAYRLNEAFPEIADDLKSQIEMFPKLYDLESTAVFPEKEDESFDEKVIAWAKQKEKRRGYAKFMMELYEKKMVPEDLVKNALQQVLTELKELAKQTKTSQSEENTTQFVDFIFEVSKAIKYGLRDTLKAEVEEIMNVPKTDFKTIYPSMNMKSKFKLEDALKELNKKD